MKSFKRMIILGCFIFALICTGCDGPFGCNRCVQTQSQGEVISGRIVLGGGGFSSGTVMYILYYPGTRQRSSTQCLYGVYVTELEYNRQMYGDK